MAESAYPVGHPGHPLYKGEPWINRADRGSAAYFPDDPAYGGKNVGPLDTPDGKRAFLNQRQNNLQDLAACGSLPPLVDPETKERIALTPEQLAHVYSVRNGISNAALAEEITHTFGLDAKAVTAAAPVAKLSDDDVAVGFLLGHGYSPEHARAILDRYGVPEVVAMKLEHERKG